MVGIVPLFCVLLVVAYYGGYLAGSFIGSADYIVLGEGVCILMKFLSGCVG